MPAHTQLAPLVPPDGDCSPSCYLDGDQGPYQPGSPLSFPPPPRRGQGGEQPSGMWERARHPGVCRPRFESQVPCSTCPVTLGRALTLPQPWGPFLQNAGPNWTHIGAMASAGWFFLPRVGNIRFLLLCDLDRPRLSPSLSFSSGIRGCRCRPPGLWELNVDEVCVGPGLGP